MQAKPELVAVGPPQLVFRVGRGPSVFDPVPWEAARPDGTFDGRFDDPAGRLSPWRDEALSKDLRFRTVYCAAQRAGAFGETIARFREPLELLAYLRGVSDEEQPDFGQPMGIIPSHWRTQRRLGSTTLDPSLEFVDVGSAATVSYLRSALAREASQLGLHDIDLSVVTGAQRLFTQEVARYIYELRDKSGSPRFAGIRYRSRLNSEWECFAIFSDRIDHRPFPQESIFPNDPGLVEAALLLGIALPDSF